MPEAPVKLRPAVRRDLPFITNSWLESYRDAPSVRGVPHTIYYNAQHRVLELLMGAGTDLSSSVFTLCKTTDEDFIIGYVCFQVIGNPGGTKALVLHYINIKEHYRKHGFAKKMIELLLESEEPDVVMFTHKTRKAWQILENKGLHKEWVYNPFLLFRQRPEDV